MILEALGQVYTWLFLPGTARRRFGGKVRSGGGFRSHIEVFYKHPAARQGCSRKSCQAFSNLFKKFSFAARSNQYFRRRSSEGVVVDNTPVILPGQLF
jgi:hypothetical protein